MALDHFVSQVHLRNFYSPAFGERMYAVRKSDGKAFTPNSQSICRIEDGSNNAYLAHDRAVEELLKTIEPKYNASVGKIAAGKIDQESVYVVAGFAAYVMTCSPAGMRIQTGPLRSALENTARALDAAKAFPELPAGLGAASLTELLEKGVLKFEVDPKYPQAVGISQILEMIGLLGNCPWEFLYNACPDSPFFTSDFPAAIERSEDVRALNRIVPLTPTLAVRMIPNVGVDRTRADVSFSQFRCRFREAAKKEVSAINRLLVQCAEDLVLYRDDLPWVRPFIKKYSAFRIEAQTNEFPFERGEALLFRQRIVRTARHVPGSSP